MIPAVHHAAIMYRFGYRLGAGRLPLVVRDAALTYHSVMPEHKLILELSRLALAGDSAATRRFLAKTIRQVAPDDEAGMELREGLAKLLLGASASARTEQHARRAVSTVDMEAFHLQPDSSQLTRVERVGDAPAPVLSKSVHRVLDSIVMQRQQVDLLRSGGVDPTRSLLLTGLPGVGKTMTARYLAAVLGLPLVTVDLTAIMSSFLGQTGQNLRRAIDVARATSCVFFIDEVDALAKRRNDETDVGELKRTVNILLLELERWPAHSMLVAATNHPELLDRAIWRRFDSVVHLPRPRFDTRLRILARALADYGHVVEKEHLGSCAAATEGLAGSGLAQLTRDAIREALLAGDGQIGPWMVHIAMRDLLRRSRRDERARGAFCVLAAGELHMSHREIAKRIGISHVQVGRLIKQRQNAEAAAT